MDWNRLAKLVKEMRSAQRKARHTRAATDLMLARDLELAVDRMLRLWKPEKGEEGPGSLLDWAD